jgi:hypothetical protein
MLRIHPSLRWKVRIALSPLRYSWRCLRSFQNDVVSEDASNIEPLEGHL